MELKYTLPNTDKPLLDILSSGVRIAVTAPLLLDDQCFLGYSPEIDSPGCLVLPANDAHKLIKSIYQPKINVTRVHGLKRIWEELNIGTRDVNLDLIRDTKLMAYLLDPDADDRELTLSALAAQYLGEEYPHRILEIRDKGYPEAFYEALAYDAELIWRLEEKLSESMSEDLQRLYRQLELPLMVILDEMRRTGMEWTVVLVSRNARGYRRKCPHLRIPLLRAKT